MTGRKKQVVKKSSRSPKPKAQPSKKRRVEPEQVVEEPLEETPDQEDPIENIPLSEQFIDPERQLPDPPNLLTFKNEAARNNFNKLFRFKIGLYEQEISKEGTNEPFWNKLQALGWEKLLTVEPKPVNLTFLRELFSNAKTEQSFQAGFFVRGLRLNLERGTIANHLQLPIYGPDLDYEKRLSDLASKDNLDVLEMVKNDLCPTSPWIKKDEIARHSVSTVSWNSSLKMIFKFITNRLHPTSHSTTISAEHLKLVYAIHHNIPVDAALIMRKNLTSYIQKPTKHMIFPHLLTDMATKQNVPSRPTDILILPKTKSLVEKSTKARHGSQHELPPPAPGPSKPTQQQFQQTLFESLGSIREWRIKDQQEMSTQRTILERIGSKLNVDISDLPKFIQESSEYSPFVQRFVPPYLDRERPRGETSGVGAAGSIDGSGGSSSADLTGPSSVGGREESDRVVGSHFVGTGTHGSAVLEHQQMVNALGSDIAMNSEEG